MYSVGIVSKQTDPLSVLVELEDLLLRAIHVHNVDCAVERLEEFVSLVLLVRVAAQGVDEREVNWLSTFILIEAAWHEPSFFDVFSYFA